MNRWLIYVGVGIIVLAVIWFVASFKKGFKDSSSTNPNSVVFDGIVHAGFSAFRTLIIVIIGVIILLIGVFGNF